MGSVFGDRADASSGLPRLPAPATASDAPARHTAGMAPRTPAPKPAAPSPQPPPPGIYASKYHPALGALICARLAAGESLRAICRADPVMPTEKTVWNWTRAHTDFAAAYVGPSTVRRRALMTGVGSYFWRSVESPEASARSSSRCSNRCFLGFGIGDTYCAGRRRSITRFVGCPLSSNSQSPDTHKAS
jgi:hypothetical protein